MKTLKIAECFFSIHGEGARAGDPSVFVRLAGCNLACGYCDTEFASGKDMTCEQLRDEIRFALRRGNCRLDAPNGDIWIVWTGGEPTEQLTDEHVKWFRDHGFRQAIETNGTNRVPPGIDWVACSPKVAEHVLAKSFPDGVDELRYVRHAGQPGVPVPSIQAKQLFLSPMFDGNRPNKDNLAHCIKLCLENPRWSLSLQTHKLINVL